MAQGTQVNMQIIKKSKARRRGKMAFAFLALDVAMVTAMAMALPALAWERAALCGKQEHTHEAGCYTSTLVCQEHIHGDGCYAASAVLQCALEETPGHAHADACYAYTCGLEEGAVHTHTKETCYSPVCGMDGTDGHIHSVSCYKTVCGVEEGPEHAHSMACCETVCGLTDTPHVHTDGCRSLTCALTECEAHIHGAACYGEERVLTCTTPESAGHAHTDGCYQSALACTLEEHTHSQDCYDNNVYALYHTLPSGERVAGVVYPQQDGSAGLGALRSGGAEPVRLEEGQYITAFRLLYQAGDGWVNITDGTQDVPASAAVRLEADYAQVPIASLLDCDGLLTLQGPDILKNYQAGGAITSGGDKVGEVTLVSGQAMLQLDTGWLQAQQDSGNAAVGGSFYLAAQFDSAKAAAENPYAFALGGYSLILRFESDAAAAPGVMELAKSADGLVLEEDGAYLSYTLAVSVPAPESGGAAVPEVRVVDWFTGNAEYALGYAGVSGAAQSTADTAAAGGPVESHPAGLTPGQVSLDGADAPGRLVWSIGDMQPGETRTLSYRVKLSEDYMGQTVANTAAAYSGAYQMAEAAASYAPDPAAFAIDTLAAGDNVRDLTITLTDAATGAPIAGAVFSLWQDFLALGVDGSIQEDDSLWHNPTTATTDENGVASFANLTLYYLYRVQQTSAPTGYGFDSGYHYFMIADDFSNDSVRSAERNSNIIVTDEEDYALALTNSGPKATLNVPIYFAPTTGPVNAGAIKAGSYTVAVYDNPAGTGEPVQTQTAIYAEGAATTQTLTFSLAPNTTYYVFELDDSGNPVAANSSTGTGALVSGHLFYVIYSLGTSYANAVPLGAAGSSSSLWVTNRHMEAYELPETGGMGVWPFVAGGLALLAALWKRNNRKPLGPSV